MKHEIIEDYVRAVQLMRDGVVYEIRPTLLGNKYNGLLVPHCHIIHSRMVNSLMVHMQSTMEEHDLKIGLFLFPGRDLMKGLYCIEAPTGLVQDYLVTVKYTYRPDDVLEFDN
jgi:hypothetical protein